MSISDIHQAIMSFDRSALADHIKAELAAGTGIADILDDGMIAAMDEVGEKFSRGELFVPEMLIAAQTMKSGLELLKPNLTDSGSQPKSTVIIGTVKGDMHDIGKNLVIMMLEGAGFYVVDLGVDVQAGRFVSAAKEHKAQLVALSALLTTTMGEMEACVAGLKEQGLGVKTMVGGAPVSQEFADRIGADGYAADAGRGGQSGPPPGRRHVTRPRPARGVDVHSAFHHDNAG